MTKWLTMILAILKDCLITIDEHNNNNNNNNNDGSSGDKEKVGGMKFFSLLFHLAARREPFESHYYSVL